MHVELHKYLELNADFSSTTPYILVGTGALIILIGTLACCCTLKGHPALLYWVNICFYMFDYTIIIKCYAFFSMVDF